MGTGRCSSGTHIDQHCLPRCRIRTSIDVEDNYIVRFRTPKVLLAFVAVAILWGCSQSDTPTLPDADFFVTQGTPVLLRFGESVGVQTPASVVLVQMSDLLQDSRCPETVTCVEAGHATVRLAVQTALSIQEIEVEVPPDGDVEVVVEEVTLRIIGLRPAAQEDVTIDVLDYALAFSLIQTGEIGVPK